MAEMRKYMMLASYVQRKLESFQRNALHANAALAELRRAVGKTPYQVPHLLGLTLEGLPEELLAKTEELSAAEWAIHLTMTLFALHQRGKDLQSDFVHRADVSFGEALAQFANSSDNVLGITRRFTSMLKATDIQELSYYLRNIIPMLSNENIAFDYARLAKDFYFFQFDESRDRVKLQWSRAFYIKQNKKTEEDDNE